MLSWFVTRCQAPLGNVIHTPTFLKQAKRLSNCLRQVSPETRATALANTFSTDTLACFLLAETTASRVKKLQASDVQSRWRSLALRCLRGHATIFGGSIAGLQAAVMLLLDGLGESMELDSVLVSAIPGARRLGLRQLGHFELEASA